MKARDLLTRKRYQHGFRASPSDIEDGMDRFMDTLDLRLRFLSAGGCRSLR